ncbi:MAG: C-GCAxxG-C-C family protein [Candidatus Aminicenantes bacterium]|nr:C-GCAxxG-C-C family protein [Candidatus Aminicenantes bacterium]
MTDREKNANSCFNEGFSCSQAVLTAYSDLFNLDRNTALKISQPFGGGIAHQGETCGAVSAAFMVIGLKYGRIQADDIAAREKTYEKILDFIAQFSSKNGSTVCKELLGSDMSTPEGLKKAEDAGLFHSLCPKLIQSSVEILDKILLI